MYSHCRSRTNRKYRSNLQGKIAAYSEQNTRWLMHNAPMALRPPEGSQTVIAMHRGNLDCSFVGDGNHCRGRRAELGASASNDHLIVCPSDIRVNNMGEWSRVTGNI